MYDRKPCILKITEKLSDFLELSAQGELFLKHYASTMHIQRTYMHSVAQCYKNYKATVQAVCVLQRALGNTTRRSLPRYSEKPAKHLDPKRLHWMQRRL